MREHASIGLRKLPRLVGRAYDHGLALGATILVAKPHAALVDNDFALSRQTLPGAMGPVFNHDTVSVFATQVAISRPPNLAAATGS